MPYMQACLNREFPATLIPLSLVLYVSSLMILSKAICRDAGSPRRKDTASFCIEDKRLGETPGQVHMLPSAFPVIKSSPFLSSKPPAPYIPSLKRRGFNGADNNGMLNMQVA